MYVVVGLRKPLSNMHDLSQYMGKVSLVVNVASNWGQTDSNYKVCMLGGVL